MEYALFSSVTGLDVRLDCDPVAPPVTPAGQYKSQIWLSTAPKSLKKRLRTFALRTHWSFLYFLHVFDHFSDQHHCHKLLTSAATINFGTFQRSVVLRTERRRSKLKPRPRQAHGAPASGSVRRLKVQPSKWRTVQDNEAARRDPPRMLPVRSREVELRSRKKSGLWAPAALLLVSLHHGFYLNYVYHVICGGSHVIYL